MGDLRRECSLREVECQFRTRRGTVHTMLVSAEIIEVNREPHMLGFCFDGWMIDFIHTRFKTTNGFTQ